MSKSSREELGRRLGAAKTVTPDAAAQVDAVDVPRSTAKQAVSRTPRSS